MSGEQILPGTGRGTADRRSVVEGAGREGLPSRPAPSVSASRCHLPAPGTTA